MRDADAEGSFCGLPRTSQRERRGHVPEVEGFGVEDVLCGARMRGIRAHERRVARARQVAGRDSQKLAHCRFRHTKSWDSVYLGQCRPGTVSTWDSVHHYVYRKDLDIRYFLQTQWSLDIFCV